ncbi:MICAL-like protein 1 isoform X1 [Maniola hyperantus]|uniref:MICAL-like protein 1 isoform X1 n=1 Tax=Aphantopus hyperantus TaxID=2795564 RepID=UPI001569F184|nr:MICAL-like protein 1 isoform X3 [Maniola hyperantus]
MSEVKGTKALELWCKRLVKDCPDVKIDNMTTSWRNGMAFCALVHHFRPDLIDLSKLKPEDIYENNELAYSIAEKHLGIPALLDPEDMVENEIPDRLSILTYLSQFYQRLGHTVNTKASESEPKVSSSATNQTSTPIKFGKVALDKCAACGLPVYLAQRLMVSQKLYHRRCFRCSKCLGHLNPKNYHVIDTSEFSCDTCKNEKNTPKLLNNNDQIGMLAFSGDVNSSQGLLNEKPVSTKISPRPQSILEKINMFEKNIEKETSIQDKIGSISLKDNYNDKCNDREVYKSIDVIKPVMINSQHVEIRNKRVDLPPIEDDNLQQENDNIYKDIPEKTYRSNKDKFIFLQTQLSNDALDANVTFSSEKESNSVHIKDDCYKDVVTNDVLTSSEQNGISDHFKSESNITDDIRLAQNTCIATNIDTPLPSRELHTNEEQEISISVPPRRKKQNLTDKKIDSTSDVRNSLSKESILHPMQPDKKYPDHLNPFSDDEDEHDETEMPRRVSTNPFGSSEEEDDDVPPIHPPPKVPDVRSSTPMKKLIKAYNPFWSDGEEPSSDEEASDKSSNMHKSSITTSTPNLPASTPRRRKPKAPPPPAVIAEHLNVPSTSMDDVASISSFSSQTTIHSDQKSIGKSTPKLKKRRPAPTPPDSLSMLSGYGESLEKSIDLSDARNTPDARRMKGPAPGLPLPERRAVKLQLLPEELQVQLELLETQQLGLERQGVLLEQMIRDKCEGDDGPTAPQEEIEDLVIQLCELVNEKNDLFRKQTELMYIRRQQRLEQEQADIEHEIRVLQSRPAANRIDADKAREEQLVSRLVEVVRLRDELVQQLDAERRRERQEDYAIAASIASKRAQRNSESNSSSIKSADAVTPLKKNKVKDKVKKQLKKAKHTLISKKKDEDKPEKDKKSK